MGIPLHPERRIPLEGAFNFRDLGGYPTGDGRTLRWRTLFRADGLSALTAADLDLLCSLGLRTVIDLRTEGEVIGRGRIEWPTAELAYHHLPMMDVLPPEDQYHSWADPIHVAEQYVAMLSGGRETVRSALRVLSDSAAYPAVCHCMAGKDRTGILSALVLGLVGVADADIVADYALSRAAMTRLLERLRAERPDRQAQIDRSAAAIVAADPATMEHFLARFRAEQGSFDTFAAALGLARAAERLQAVLLQPA